MLRAIIYKEWLKIRVAAIISVCVGLLFILDFYLGLSKEIDFATPKEVVYGIVHQRALWFKHLRFIPVLIGVLMGIVQYYPEVVNNKLKLSFHLPVGERKVLCQMLGFGFCVTLLILMLMFVLFVVVCGVVLPNCLVRVGAITILPWFLAGLISYFWIAFTVLEPTWKLRITYTVFGVLNVSSFLIPAGLVEYQNVIYRFVFIAIGSGFGIFFTAYRLKKGLK